jgi:hypothetical protein
MPSVLEWNALTEKEYEKPQFLLEPYIPREGIVFLWSKSSVGKTPLTIEMGRCIAEGVPFLGLPTQQGRVLYVEVDSPEQVTATRVKAGGLKLSQGVFTFIFSPPTSLPMRPVDLERAFSQLPMMPDVVFINTLRKIHDLDDKDSRSPKIVYTYFKKMFPTSALVFVHHERKDSADPRSQPLDSENFSGSMHWINDAQVGLHLKRSYGRGHNRKLLHVKSQVTRLLSPLPMSLLKDGMTYTSDLLEQSKTVSLVEEETGRNPVEIARSLGFSDLSGRLKDLESQNLPASFMNLLAVRDPEEDDE